MKTTARTRLVAAIALAIAALVTMNALADGTLVHRYTFDNDNANDSVGSMNPTATGSGVSYTTAAKVGAKAASLDGSGNAYIDYPTNVFGTTFSIAAWVYLVDYHNICGLLANQFGGNAQDGFCVYMNNQWMGGCDGRLFFDTGNGTDAANNSTPEHAVPSGTWAHVAAVVNRTAGTLDLYVNGELLVDDGAIRQDFQITNIWTIGAFIVFHDNAFEGKIDDVRIYDGLLTPEQISDLIPATLVHQYTFEGQNCDDAVGSLNGTPVNSPTYTNDAKRGSYAVVLDRSQQQCFTFSATDFGGLFSLAGWVKTEEPHNIATILANQNAGSAQDGFCWYVNNQWVGGSDGKVFFDTGNGTSGTSVTTPEPMSSNDWHHVAAVANKAAGAVQLYIDGMRVLTNGTTRTDFQTGSEWALGRFRNNENPFDGTMDDVRIYSGELTDSEVFGLYIPEPSVALALGAAAAIALLRRKK